MRGFCAAALVLGLSAHAYADPAKDTAKKKPVPAARASRWQAQQAKPPVLLATYRMPAASGSASNHDTPRARALHAQGMSAYQAGNYNGAAKAFAAALEVSSSPELIWHAAEAFRLKGDRANALELYERYLDEAPDGPAAPVCRWRVERLRDTP